MVKLPCPGRTEVARLVTGALRQALQREQLGRLVKSQKRTPMHFSLGAGLITVYHGGLDKDLYWVRCPDAALVPCGQSRPSLVVEVGMPGESQSDLQERCRRWLCEPYAHDQKGDEDFQPTSVISLHIRPWQGSEQHLVTAALLVQGDHPQEVHEYESVTFVNSSVAGSDSQGGSDIVSGEAVWRLPVRYLIGSLAEEAEEVEEDEEDKEQKREQEEGEKGDACKEGHMVAVTVELDVLAALAGIGKALCGPG
ncbi:hypothetical protein GPECTOR_77g15 [Gonium pectorale]|uniref:Uncharacterized protein n=1 Tax=Gonium pectorale TaxID=33097 RepID=A0A150G253_GONPE|nr:hypothetical protein GPECTOR_77g15 [Gonium pectorale]|eukprot:KXZ43918.1 hypothetical protein GPECTOR_77g15 [Gonium pectorale]